MIAVTGLLVLWTGDSASWHFLGVPAEQSDEIRTHGLADRRGFGSVRVEARLGDTVWRTSLFPLKGGGYMLPVKAAVRRDAAIAAGDEVTVTLELL